MIATCHETPAQKTAHPTIQFAIGDLYARPGSCRHYIAGYLRDSAGERGTSAGRQLRSIFPCAALRKESKELDEVLKRVVQFIETPAGILDLPLEVRGTSFQKKVWEALKRIPEGQTITYKELALKLGATAQEIGEACAANTLAVVIPCHRVIRSDGRLAGYRWGAHRKKFLLQQE